MIINDFDLLRAGRHDMIHDMGRVLPRGEYLYRYAVGGLCERDCQEFIDGQGERLKEARGKGWRAVAQNYIRERAAIGTRRSTRWARMAWDQHINWTRRFRCDLAGYKAGPNAQIDDTPYLLENFIKTH